jgi:prevent-host-death family protein
VSDIVSLYAAKTHLSNLVDRAAAGEEIVITKNGVPCAKLVAVPSAREKRRPANLLGVTYIAGDFDEPMPGLENWLDGAAIEPDDEGAEPDGA